VESDPQNQWAHVALAKALFALDPSRTAQAEAEFAKAIDLRPDNAEIWAEAIRFWQENQQRERALSLCLQAQPWEVFSQLEELCQAP
jgi:hypothetical protein